jgi:hypothetical protein
MKILVPKRYGAHTAQDILIFLAGPVLGGGDWQRVMIEHFLNVSIRKLWPGSFIKYILPRVTFIVPCRWGSDHPLAKYFVRQYETIADSMAVHELAGSQTA